MEDKALSILIIEDSNDFRHILVQYLKKEGIKADSAANGQAGLEKFIRNPKEYDAILMDIQMPVMSGREALIRIRDTDEGKDIPVIALTGSEDTIEAGSFDIFLRKPFQLEYLCPTIQRIVADKKIGAAR